MRKARLSPRRVGRASVTAATPANPGRPCRNGHGAWLRRPDFTVMKENANRFHDDHLEEPDPHHRADCSTDDVERCHVASSTHAKAGHAVSHLTRARGEGRSYESFACKDCLLRQPGGVETWSFRDQAYEPVVVIHETVRGRGCRRSKPCITDTFTSERSEGRSVVRDRPGGQLALGLTGVPAVQ